ncbi:MAG: hypothetical protein ACJ77M_06580 [Thermoleophilaceae bacterium]|jgi:hypothetical protein
MEKHTQPSRDEREQYEAPAGIELGTLAEMTAGKGNGSSDCWGGSTIPSGTS